VKLPAWSRPTIDNGGMERSGTRVVLADDDVLLREGLASLLDRAVPAFLENR
jgi:hypothetical protein